MSPDVTYPDPETLSPAQLRAIEAVTRRARSTQEGARKVATALDEAGLTPNERARLLVLFPALRRNA